MDLAASEALPVLTFAASFQLKAQAKYQIKAHAVKRVQNLNLNGLQCTRLITIYSKCLVFIPIDFSVYNKLRKEAIASLPTKPS